MNDQNTSDQADTDFDVQSAAAELEGVLRKSGVDATVIGIDLDSPGRGASLLDAILDHIESVYAARRQTVDDEIEALIAEGKITTIGVVNEERPHESFAYTVGLTEKGLPEVIMAGGTHPEDMAGIIGSCMSQVISGTRPMFECGVKISGLLVGYDVQFVAVDPEASKMHLAVNRHGKETKAVQIVWPDPEGKFPDEDGYDERYYQPIHRLAV